MTGQPGAQAGAPTAATPQMNPAAAGDEPSVQLQQDQQQALWFDASQHSFQGPAHAGGAAGEAAARAAGGSIGAAAAAGGGRGGSKLRKASYVNSPIYQHPGKRGPGSKLHEQQQQQEEEEQQQQQQCEREAAEAEGEGEDSFGQPQKQPKQQQRKAAGAMAPPRKKVTVRKPKKAANPAATPTRGGRLAGMGAKR